MSGCLGQKESVTFRKFLEQNKYGMLFYCTMETRGGEVIAMLGYLGTCRFPGYTFCPKIQEQDISFEENCKAELIYSTGKSSKICR